jgi:hypothetical protein
LSLKEDRDIEQYTLLDGVYGQLRYPWMTLQAVAGRPIQWRNRWVELATGDDASSTFVRDEALNLRDIVIGGFGEI